MDKTTTFSWTFGHSVTISYRENFPWDILHQIRTGKKSMREGKEEFYCGCLFYSLLINHLMDCKFKRHETLFCVFQSITEGFMKFSTRWKFSSCLENVACWVPWVIFCFGPVCCDPAYTDKSHCYSSWKDEGDRTKCSLLGPLIWCMEFPAEIKKNEYKGNSREQKAG